MKRMFWEFRRNPDKDNGSFTTLYRHCSKKKTMRPGKDSVLP